MGRHTREGRDHCNMEKGYHKSLRRAGKGGGLLMGCRPSKEKESMPGVREAKGEKGNTNAEHKTSQEGRVFSRRKEGRMAFKP